LPFSLSSSSCDPGRAILYRLPWRLFVPGARRKICGGLDQKAERLQPRAGAEIKRAVEVRTV
jgi:hypothetical protein